MFGPVGVFLQHLCLLEKGSGFLEGLGRPPFHAGSRATGWRRPESRTSGSISTDGGDGLTVPKSLADRRKV
jgi:hypothetical protein